MRQQRERRHARGSAANCSAQLEGDGSRTVSLGAHTASQADKASTRASSGVVRGAAPSCAGLDADAGKRALLSPYPGDSMTLNELPDGALGRLLLLKSGRVIWCLGSEKEPEEERERRRAEQIRRFPVCPWEKPEGRKMSKEERRRRRLGRTKSQHNANDFEAFVTDRQDPFVQKRKSFRSGESPGARWHHSSRGNVKNHKKGTRESRRLIDSSSTVTTSLLQKKPKNTKRVVESSDSDAEEEGDGDKEEEAQLRKTSKNITRMCGAREEDMTSSREGKQATSGFNSSMPKKEQETRGADFFFRVDVGCDCIFKQECAVMLHDNKEFVLFGKPFCARARGPVEQF